VLQDVERKWKIRLQPLKEGQYFNAVPEAADGSVASNSKMALGIGCLQALAI